MQITLFGEDYDAVYIQTPVPEPTVKPIIKLRSLCSVYGKYDMSGVFEFNDKFKPRDALTTPTTCFPESVSSESLDIIEANLEELQKLITLDIQPSIFDGLEQYEKPDQEAIDKLLKSDLLETVKYESFEYDNERQHLKAYKNAINKDGLVKVCYKKKPFRLGRAYAKHSLGAINLRKEIRGTIFIDRYVDIDVVNCHPSIIFQVAKSLNISCPNLEKILTIGSLS